MAWYNDSDPANVWFLRDGIERGMLTAGVVDGRDMRDVRPADVGGPWAHFFAGVGGWDLALRLGGWPADFPVWTGSCPCQPFSAAGKRRGSEDARHLWPEWYRLIRECAPPVVLGEQVASNDGIAWLAAVRADMECAGYAVGAADLCAASVGAPHPRQRLFWGAVRMADGDGSGLERPIAVRIGSDERAPRTGGLEVWTRFDLVPLLDGTLRPTEPGVLPVADGIPGRVAAIRGFGNAIVPQVAAQFVRAVMEWIACD